MRKFLILIATILVACTSCKQQNSQGKTLVVSILPIKYLVERITGSDFEIEVLVPPGSSPETYEPTPRQMSNVADASFVFTTGLLDFEQELSRKIDADAVVVALSKGVKLIEGQCSGAMHSHHHHGIDPHIWLSPSELSLMASNIFDEISVTYPDSAKYRDRYYELIADLEELDREIGAKIRASDIKHIFIYHPALTYYTARYGIDQIAIEEDGKEPAGSHLKRLVDLGRELGVSRIFYQREFSSTNVEIIARDIEAEMVEIDPLAYDVISNLRHITDVITLE